MRDRRPLPLTPEGCLQPLSPEELRAIFQSTFATTTGEPWSQGNHTRFDAAERHHALFLVWLGNQVSPLIDDVWKEFVVPRVLGLPSDCLAAKQINVLGQLELDVLLFLPQHAAHQGRVDLYVEGEYHSSLEILPDYLSFVSAVVNLTQPEARHYFGTGSEERREKVLKVYGRIVARNVIKMLKELEPSVYARFWREFGSAIKDGVATVERCRGGLLELLRFETSLGGGLASLREYVSRMPAEQHHILCAMDRTTASQHEVLYVDSSDWEMLRSLEFDGRTFAELQAGGGAVAPAVQHTAAPQGGGWSPRMRRILEAHIEAQRERMDPASYQALMDQMAAQAATPWSV